MAITKRVAIAKMPITEPSLKITYPARATAKVNKIVLKEMTTCLSIFQFLLSKIIYVFPVRIDRNIKPFYVRVTFEPCLLAPYIRVNIKLYPLHSTVLRDFLI